ncbi:MAG TPA: HAMP domain-containing sensor histidine kinase [Trebonia sp.]|nr:HAMP domain-containing sensor histidine kinase [Trebonia sp.]
MPDSRPHPASPRLLRLPRPTARLRLTVLYGAAFLACGAAVLAFAYLYFGYATHRASSSGPLNGASPLHNVAVIAAPAAQVRQAGRYDEFPVPAVLITHAGPDDELNVPVPVPSALQAHLAAEAGKVLAAARQQLLTGCAVALAVIAAAAAAIGWLIAGRVLRPLSTITAAARRISASSLDERLALHGPDDELKELGDTLDSLFARLQASFDAQRRFAANASHELRTPLTRERTLLQVTLADPDAAVGTWQAVGRELLASNAEQDHLIEALLTLASSEAGLGEHQSLDLAAVAGAALAAIHPAISRLGLHVQTDIRPAALNGDPLLVERLVTNLVDNAVRHNVAGGDVRVATGTSDGRAVLSVASSGPVIPAAEVDRLFQPFQRFGPRPARRDGGHGLGLSIVRAIAAAHAAAITAQPRPGGGLAIDVTFPPPQQQAGPGAPARHLARA